MPSEKARRPREKKRALSKGPRRQRGPTNHGNGKKFEPGQNSHDGTVFRRGPDAISRGSGLLMLRQVFHDQRQAIYDNLSKLVESPRGAHAFVMDYTDRTEGKAKQVIENHVRRSTTFAPAPEAQSTPPSESAAGTASETASETVGPNGERMVRL